MQLTINATDANDLAQQVKNLAQLLGVEVQTISSQIPMDLELKEEDTAEEPKKEEAHTPKDIAKRTRTRSSRARLGDEPAATINHVEEVDDKQTPEEKPVPATRTKQEVADACQSVSTTKNLEDARKILGEFQDANGAACRRISDLKVEDYQAFITKCEEAIK